MRFIDRLLAPVIQDATRGFPSLVLTGPRRAGKTSLLRRLFPTAQYLLLEDPETLSRVRSDPRAFIESLKPPVIFDEIQNAPELFNFIRALIDQAPRRHGRYLFTGSQESSLMVGVSESMAGRAAILHLLPLSAAETNKVTLLSGGYPESLANRKRRNLWFSSYVQTYLERDVRGVTNVHDLAVFRRFMTLVTSRHGQILNKTDLAAPLGVSVPTIDQWLRVLEITAQIILLPPYFENLGKRLVKSPRLYLTDSGLACHLLGIESQRELERSVFFGPIFEGFIAAEIVKAQVNSGRRRELYLFRDQQGLEVDFVLPRRNREIWLIEAKSTRTPRPEMAEPMSRLAKAFKGRRVRNLLVYRSGSTGLVSSALAPGAQALTESEFIKQLNESS